MSTINPLAPCPWCGLAHDPRAMSAAAHIEDLYGDTVPISTPDGTWAVPRSYVALHGLASVELPALAQRFGWRPMSTSDA